MIESLFQFILAVPFAWMILLGFIFFSRVRLQERVLTEAVKYFSFSMALMTGTLMVLTFMHSSEVIYLNYPAWIEVGEYDFKIRFIVDLLGSTYALLSSLLIGIIFRFSKNYLHKEEGYFRFIFLLSVLLFGLMIVSFARSLDLLFAGWELVGTTSVLLISYFYGQVQPVRHAVKAIISYRLCDMGILAASAWAHHYLHTTDFSLLASKVSDSHHDGGFAFLFIGVFIIWASLAKAGQLPMSSWLPTAMEGPTPSSAIFYGALSVHLGPFLLLRFHDYLTLFPSLLWAIGLIGGFSAVYASAVGRTRTDAKTMLAYATITQVGLIYIEIALGFTDFALIHIVAHGSLRTWQFLRSSSLIQDFFENPVVQKDVSIRRRVFLEKVFPIPLRKKIFIHALHGFHLEFFTQKVIEVVCYPFKLYMDFEKRSMDINDRLIKFLFRKG